MIPVKLNPIDRSIIGILKDAKRELTLRELAIRIPYANFTTYKEWLPSIVERLSSCGYIESIDGRFMVED